MKATTQYFIKFILFSLLCSLVLTFWGRGSFLHSMGVGIPAFWLGAPLLVASVIMYVVSLFNKSPGMKKTAIKGITIVIFLAIQLLSLVGGKWIYQKEVAEAKAYCLALIPQLEAYKASHGKYPRTNELDISTEKLPRMLRTENNFYHSDGEKIYISFRDSGGIFGSYIYNVKKKYWAID